MKSPGRIPPLSAGEARKTWEARAPFFPSRPNSLEISLSASINDTPSQPYLICPELMKSSKAFLALFMGIAKPSPTDPPEGEAIQVLIPTTSPLIFTRAPPELPWLIAASVWMKSLMFSAGPPVRPTALTMPMVTEDMSPRGLPTAIAQSPTLTESESPSTATGKASLDSKETRARSFLWSFPTRAAVNSLAPLVMILISEASPTTCWFVST